MYSVFLKSFLLLKDWYRCFHYENVFIRSNITFFSKKPAVLTTGFALIFVNAVILPPFMHSV